jgi:hypothetical protein
VVAEAARKTTRKTSKIIRELHRGFRHRSNSIRVLSGVASSLIKGSGLGVLELKSCMCVHAFLWNDLYQTCR